MFFLDALKAIDDEEVYIEFGTNISPCIIRSVENNDYTYMRILDDFLWNY